ncbi:DUF1080 domain-containing protein [Spongiimicrobium sp. 3-5]|uniref:3-keto-disaccharide hydrolase n=1 Tax=Spongiimicrobium sp. 3-5 TaxID=3332596 RepID=UPI00397F943E
MKKLFIAFLIVCLASACKDKTKTSEGASEMATEDASEQLNENDDQWIVLFDGTSFDAWKGYLKDEMPAEWKLEDNAMVFYPPEQREEGESFNIVTKADYTNFVLSIEWRISDAGNSGIFWGVKEDPNLPEAYQSGPEIQVLDNTKHPDAKVNGKTHQAGSLYDMVAPSQDVTKPAGEWNTCIITVNHKVNKGSVVLNEVEIASFPVNGEPWNTMVSKSKFADWEHFGKYPTGKIGLQDHGDVVAYRNIKIKEL